MRKRVVRDLIAIVGVALVLGVVVFFNTTLNRTDLAQKMDLLRQKVERERKSLGLELLDWSLLRTTQGRMSSGPTFTEELKSKGDQRVDIVGFMVPLDTFRDINEFMLLPLPIECYFCQIPPMRDVMLVQLKEGQSTSIYKEPVLINGTLKLNEGKGVKFFYEIREASMGPGEPEGSLTPRYIKPQHMVPEHEKDESALLDGYDPPVETEDVPKNE